MLFDTHAHLNDERYRDDLDVVLERSVNAGVDRILIASYDLDSSRSSVELASKINGGVCSVGLHPHDAVNFNDEILANIAVKFCMKAETKRQAHQNCRYFECSEEELLHLRQGEGIVVTGSERAAIRVVPTWERV